MTTIPAARQLSPKVRRLLREHGLQARAVAGTGRGGRVTPQDVLGAAGVPHGARRGAARGAERGSVLASPLARRLLRDAGLDLPAATRASDHRRITRADAERLIDERAVDTDAGSPPATPTRTDAVAVAEVEADVGRLLAALAANDSPFRSHNGFELPVEVAVASAAAAVLVRRPELIGPTGPAGEHGAAPDISIGFVAAGPQGPTVAVVPDVQYLTVGGLARRARAAVELIGGGEPTPAGASGPTLVVTTDDVATAGIALSGDLGLLTVGSSAPRRVAGADEFGHEVVWTRPHTTLRLHHRDPTAHEAAAPFLEELGAAVAAWSLPVGP